MNRDSFDASNEHLLGLSDFGHQDALISISPESHLFESTFEDPIAQVLLDLPVFHMDRIFEYEIPQRFSDLAVGTRVVVELGNRKVDGFVIGRTKYTSHMNRLRPITKVISPIPVLQPQVLAMARRIADSHFAVLADVLRLAIPQRHARAEKEFLDLPEFDHPCWQHPEIPDFFSDYDGAQALSLIGTDRIGGVVHVLPKHREFDFLAFATQQALACGKTALIVVSTPKQAYDLAKQLSEQLENEPIAVSTSQDSHEVRYKHFLAALFGKTRVVVGTRSATWTPLKDLGLCVLIDDHHGAFQEKRTPYVNARDILYDRFTNEGSSFLILNHGPSLEGSYLFHDEPIQISASVKARRQGTPQILAANKFAFEGAQWSRMPDSVFKVVRDGLARGPVLVVVPQAGYIPMVKCVRCGEIPVCTECGGHLHIPAPDQPLRCERCAKEYRDFTCSNCGFTKTKAIKIGSHRTAQEIGRAFPRTSINLIGPENFDREISDKPKIVICTPGYEPRTKNGFTTAVVLDAGYLLRSHHLESESYFLRTMAKIASRVRTRNNDGKLLIVGDVAEPLLDAVGRWDFETWEQQTLEERHQLQLPPQHAWIDVRGSWEELRVFLSLLRLARKRFEATNNSNSKSKDINDLVPLDSLLLGGITSIIPGIAVLGPNHVDSGNDQIYLRMQGGDTEETFETIRAVLKEGSINGSVRGLRISINPEL
ncbi:primosomal protein N' family DNA-binding protein [Arcanobacterium ihumii]|uniref:primosomal protein N' family DNA-binding protein n=1 Tax=Arcanobacterium ihumii TaxID=2138162 RepID=UPI000F540156|nr:hypothetical protein [Arcanobacterium ihumii]